MLRYPALNVSALKPGRASEPRVAEPKVVSAISLYAGQISFNAGSHNNNLCGLGHKVKLAPYWDQ